MQKRLLRACSAVILICVFAVGMGQILAKKPAPPPGGGCPQPAPGWFCPLYYAPVECGPDDCWYSNMCFASLAGWNNNQCDPVGPGPIPLDM